MVIFSHRYLESDRINFKTFVFQAVHWAIWTSLCNTDIRVQQPPQCLTMSLKYKHACMTLWTGYRSTIEAALQWRSQDFFNGGGGGEAKGREGMEIFEYSCIKMAFSHIKCNGRVGVGKLCIGLDQSPIYFTLRLMGGGMTPLCPPPPPPLPTPVLHYTL